MGKTIIVAGATGNLGGQIINKLLAENVHVKAIARQSTNAESIAQLKSKGVEILQTSLEDINAMAKFFEGAHCIVSAVAGLQDVIIDTQKNILAAAVQAKVPRFICSDFSSDYTNLVPGKNRNLDMRRDFANIINEAPIKAISIFNGAFMELITGDMPLVMFKKNKIFCWGNTNTPMEFTHTNDVAAFTALAAISDCTDRYLHIAGDVKSSNQFVELLSRLSNSTYKLLRPGGIGLFNFMIGMTKLFVSGKTELYPPWQGMQYMRDMMEGRIEIKAHQNDKFRALNFLSIEDYFKREKFEKVSG
jgi:nucleoside-diphosphate-sugar epimerase